MLFDKARCTAYWTPFPISYSRKDTVEGRTQIAWMVEQVMIEFTEVDDIKNLIRNSERLFPEDMDRFDAKRMRRVFVKLRRENEKKK